MYFNYLTRSLVAVTVLGFAMLPAAAQPQNPAISTSTSFAWRTMTQAVCLERAMAGVNAAIGQFPLEGMTVRQDDWYVVGGGPDTDIWIDCIADDGTTTTMVNAQVDRLLVAVIVNSLRGELATTLRAFIVDCMASGTCGQTGKVTPVTDWTTNAIDLRGRNGQRIEFECPAIGDTAMGAVWGTDVYSDDSAVCAAAVHAGAITIAGGTVTIEILPGRATYEGTTRNGVTTFAWTDPFEGSYRVIVGGTGGK